MSSFCIVPLKSTGTKFGQFRKNNKNKKRKEASCGVEFGHVELPSAEPTDYMWVGHMLQ